MHVDLKDDPLFLFTGGPSMAHVKFEIEWLNPGRVALRISSIVHPSIYLRFCNAIRISDPFYLQQIARTNVSHRS
jgi:hypothetical protein